VKAAVLTISDSSFKGERPDTSGPAVRAILDAAGWAVTIADILPDEADTVSARLRELCDSGEVDAVLTTGGTGAAARDVTPEATRAVLDKEMPGLSERMRAEGMKSTPLAALSRAICGIRGSVLIVNLPGSPKGATESLSAILELVPHVIRLLHGETGH
jgi:molybdenum cofactor synthesis domain-containing protein